MRALIVDDEPLARARLKRLLQAEDFFEQIDEAENAQQAINLQQQFLPEVIFLDINLPQINGLELAHSFNQLVTPPAIIFTTAYAEHALAAYDFSPKDYLLKPVSQFAIQKAISKLSLKTRTDLLESQLSTAKLTYVHTGIKRTIPLSKICYFRAEDKYVIAVLKEQEILLEQSLLTLQQQYPDELIRIHRRFLLNKTYCQALISRDGKHFIQCHHRRELLEISRRMLNHVKQRLEN